MELKEAEKPKRNYKMKMSPKLTKPMIKMFIFVIILFGLIFGWKYFQSLMIGRYLKTQFKTAQTVSSIVAKAEVWQPEINAIGTLRAIQGVDLSPTVSGTVTKIAFKPGTFVKENTLLIELDTDTERAHLQSLLPNAELAKQTYERAVKQFKINAISKQTLETAFQNMRSNEALVKEQEQVIEDKIIRAPFDGYLGISFVSIGQYLNPNDKIVTLQNLNPIYVDFNVPQEEVGQLKLGEKVEVSVDSYPQKFSGFLSTINPKIDPDTRNVTLEATLENNQGNLFPGMFVRVKIKKGKAVSYVTVPQTAVTFNSYGEIVFVLQADKKNKNPEHYIAQQKFVTVGKTRGDQIAILKGINANDLVVTSGQIKLHNGSEVVVNNDVTPSDSPHPNVPNES